MNSHRAQIPDISPTFPVTRRGWLIKLRFYVPLLHTNRSFWRHSSQQMHWLALNTPVGATELFVNNTGCQQLTTLQVSWQYEWHFLISLPFQRLKLTLLHLVMRKATYFQSKHTRQELSCQKTEYNKAPNLRITQEKTPRLLLLLLLLLPFYSSLDFDRDKPGEPVPEETFNHSHLSWSSIIPYLLPPSITIHDILPIQFTCLTVFLHNLCPSFLWSTSWSGTLHFVLHTWFLHPIIVSLGTKTVPLKYHPR